MTTLKVLSRAALAVCACMVLAHGLAAADKRADQGITASPIPIANPSQTVIGEEFHYPAGTPRVRAFRITIPPGKRTAWHRHEIPLFAYMVSGALEVDYGAKGVRRYAPGDGFLEAIDWCHRGRAVGDRPAVLLAVYMGGGKRKDTAPCR